jgi:hypothetical protein
MTKSKSTKPKISTAQIVFAVISLLVLLSMVLSLFVN